MITSEDVRRVTFEKSMRGYRCDDVDDYLKQVAESMDALSAQNDDLQKKLVVLAQRIDQYRAEEDTLRTTMINAQRLGENVIREAKQKAAEVIRAANMKAEDREQRARDDVELAKQEIVTLKSEADSFKRSLMEMYRKHINLISKLPEYKAPEEEETLRDLLARGQKNGVPDLALISGEEARKMEPRLSEAVTQALYAPTAGITCPFEFAIACAENARANGAEWLLNHKVTGIHKEGDFLVLETEQGSLAARRVVNAAGVYADEIARFVGDASFSIHPRKGEYLLLDRNALPLNTVLFQTPSKMGKGVLVSPTVHGNAYAGPTAVDIPSGWGRISPPPPDGG